MPENRLPEGKHTYDASVKTAHFWICELGPSIWLLTEIDEEGAESYVDALRGDFSEVATVFEQRFPGRTLYCAWGDAEV